MINTYILDENGEPVPCEDLARWAKWFHDADDVLIVGKSLLGVGTVSTVFVPLNLALDYGSEPILWETRVFGGKMHGYQERCSGSREQAEAMHAGVVAKVKKSIRWFDRIGRFLVEFPYPLMWWAGAANFGSSLFNYRHFRDPVMAMVGAMMAGFCLATIFFLYLHRYKVPARFR